MSYTIKLITIITAPTKKEARELCKIHERYGDCDGIDWVDQTGDFVERKDGYDRTVQWSLGYPPTA